MSKASRGKAESSLNSWHPWAKKAKPAFVGEAGALLPLSGGNHPHRLVLGPGREACLSPVLPLALSKSWSTNLISQHFYISTGFACKYILSLSLFFPPGINPHQRCHT